MESDFGSLSRWTPSGMVKLIVLDCSFSNVALNPSIYIAYH